jgi:hypothetical protein
MQLDRCCLLSAALGIRTESELAGADGPRMQCSASSTFWADLHVTVSRELAGENGVASQLPSRRQALRPSGSRRCHHHKQPFRAVAACTRSAALGLTTLSVFQASSLRHAMAR